MRSDTFWVRNLATFCQIVTFLIVTASSATAQQGISGQVRYVGTTLLVPSVDMQLDGAAAVTSTDANGQYAIAELAAGDHQVTPQKHGDVGRAITALDAVYALQAAIGLRTLSPAEQIACDVNGSGSITAIDAVYLLQYAVGMLVRFPVAERCGSDWAFLPQPAAAENQQLIQPQETANPCRAGAIAFHPLAGNPSNQDFAAVLYGDCARSWQPPASATLTPTATATPTSSFTPVPTASFTVTPTVTAPLPSASATPTLTTSPTRSFTATASFTITPTATSPPPTASATRSSTATRTLSFTPTATPSFTFTPTRSPSPSRTATRTPTRTPTATATASSSPTAVGTASGPVLGGCQVFPSDNPWNRDVSADPIDPSSDAYIASINMSATLLHPDFGSFSGYGIPYVIVPGSQPAVPITFVDSGDESDPGPYPVPPNAPIEGGSDRHVLVLNSASCVLYELYNASKDAVGSGWTASSGAIFDLHSNALRPDSWTSADAAGLPILPGLVRYDEVAAGAINHAVRFTVWRAQRAWVHPATHYGTTTSLTFPPMGTRLRLKASYDISSFTGESRVILTALKKYGMFVADVGTSWYITGATDPRWDDNDLDQMKTIPGSAFEVVQLGTIYLP